MILKIYMIAWGRWGIFLNFGLVGVLCVAMLVVEVEMETGKKRRRWVWCAVGVVALVLLLAGVGGYAWHFRPEAVFVRFVERARGASGVRVMEGLPHQEFESGHLAEEIKNKKVFEAHGYWFYEEPLEVEAGVVAKVVALVLDSKKNGPTVRDKLSKCGGFHPDYMLEWTAEDGRKLQAMLCFGCWEAKLFDGKRGVYCSFGARDEVRELLWGVRRNRPVTGLSPAHLEEKGRGGK